VPEEKRATNDSKADGIYETEVRVFWIHKFRRTPYRWKTGKAYKILVGKYGGETNPH
jgi:hypothetical protein